PTRVGDVVAQESTLLLIEVEQGSIFELKAINLLLQSSVVVPNLKLIQFEFSSYVLYLVTFV
ncbi:hypothetical protein, partial [Bifidobacterium breve]